MNKPKGITLTLVTTALVACGPGQKQSNSSSSSIYITETENLFTNPKKVLSRGIMFGHHDDTNYGIGWDGEEGRPDAESVCGDYSAIISFDLGHIELGDTVSLDNVLFSKIRQEILSQYERGGTSSLSWHLRNPLTGGDSWDASDTTVVKSVLPGGSNHEKFTGWVSRVSAFINSLQAEDGVKVLVLFRLWCEHTGSWFWWGEKLCTPEEYKVFWQMMVDILREDGVNNAFHAYSSGSEPQDIVQYLNRYPGDELVDVVGFDTYQFDRDSYTANLEKSPVIIDSIGKTHSKVTAITETGHEGISGSRWWTETSLPVIEKYPIVYVLVWRNARERVTRFYAPYPERASVNDFVEFYKDPKTLFVADVNSLYK